MSKMRKNFSSWAIVIVIFFAFESRGIFVDSQEAVAALQNQGYESVVINSNNWFFVSLRGCSSNDAAKFTAKVINPAKKEAEVFVCIGWPFKGATVRSY